MDAKVKVGVLGATGTVGQQFVRHLASHPWFDLSAIAASQKSVGWRYGERVQDAELPDSVADMILQPCEPPLDCDIIFSALDSNVAGPVEQRFAEAGYTVVSNARNHRMDPRVPIVVPEVNANHLRLLDSQPWEGSIVTNPNCVVAGLALALAPLHHAFGIEALNVVTLQAISGAGYPGVASLDILDNVIPWIEGEESKVASEPLKILGTLRADGIDHADFPISVQVNRVPVIDGHMSSVSIKLRGNPSVPDVCAAWREFNESSLALPTGPSVPLILRSQPAFPQPRRHRDLQQGMAVSVGRVRQCPVLGVGFVCLSHNTVRGAAGNALLIAEYMTKASVGAALR